MTSTLTPWQEDTARAKSYPQFLLFGDSITQGSHRTLIPDLSEWYLRRLDIVNRGFSGYTAPRGVGLLSQFFPAHSPSSSNPQARLMTVFFGANDACLPGCPQHVPLDEYKDALRQIASHEGLRLHDTQLIFITPGPVDEYQMPDHQRTASNTAIYAAACREVASDLRVPVLDLWGIFMAKAGWKGEYQGEKLPGSLDAPRNEVFSELLMDGLHFSNKAYSLLYDELKRFICHNLPDYAAENTPVVFPDWKDELDVRA